MSVRGFAAAAVLLALAACAAPPADPSASSSIASTPTTPAQLPTELPFRASPFEAGAIAVVASEAGGLRTWRLVPCREGRAVCAWGAEGSAGTLRAAPGWVVVTGLDGRAFWLDSGGRGFVERNGRFLPLAWTARSRGTGDGTAAAMESAAPHGILRPGPDAASQAAPSGRPPARDAWGAGSGGMVAVGGVTAAPMSAWPAPAGATDMDSDAATSW